MLETGGPVTAFADALVAGDMSRAAGLLAPDVQLCVPPLHYVSSGAPDVVQTLTALLVAFRELRYNVRSRYLAPGSVTDEAVLVGRQTGTFLGAGPSRRTSSVPVRVIVEHDERLVTRITVWPEVAALRAAVAGVHRVIDLTQTAEAGGVIASLRATMPPRRPRIIIGEERQAPEALAPAPSWNGSGDVGHADGELVINQAVPKPPVPKIIRRRRAALAGGSMLIAACALASWVAIGALNLADSSESIGSAVRVHPADVAGNEAGKHGRNAGPGADGPSGSKGSGGTTTTTADGGSGSTSGTTSAPPATQLATGNNTVTMSSDLLFATNSANLTPKARQDLAALIAQARRQQRPGTVIVSGYTDNRGGKAYNLRLSERRAAAVAEVLRAGLTGRGMKVRSKGYGETRPAGKNDTPEGRQANRRVTVTFPPVRSSR